MRGKIIKTLSELEEFLEVFNSSVFAFDTECTSLKYYDLRLVGISLSDGTNSCYLPVGHKDDNNFEDISVLFSILHDLFTRAELLIAHNMSYDAAVLKKYSINIFNVEWFDTMVAAHLINENGEKGLKKLSLQLLNYESQTLEEVSGSNYNVAMTPVAKLAPYAIDDAKNTYDLSIIFKEKLREEGLVTLFRKIEMPFLRPLIQMETNGVRVDLEKVDTIGKQLINESINLQTKMLDSIGVKYSMTYQNKLFGEPELQLVSPINLNSSVELSKILFDKLGLPIIERTPSGTPSTGTKTINKLAGKHEFVALLQKYKVVVKLLSAFFNPLPILVDGDGRVRPSFNDVGTVTGRLSCSKPNLQQLPKPNKAFPIATRSCFIASPGKKMIAVDYSQQELRIMAQLTEDPMLLKIIQEGGDIHLINANAAFNIGIPDEYCYTSHPKYEETKAKYKDYRDKGKVFSFSIPYGAGAPNLSMNFNVSIEEAEELLKNYFEKFPNLKKGMDDTQIKAERDGYVTTYTGRRRRFERNQWGKLEAKAVRQSFNFLIQSFGADLIRLASVKLYNYAIRRPELGLKLLMTVHDEIVMECNEEYAEEVKKDSEKILQSCGRLIVPLLAEASIGDNYAEAK